VTQDQIKAVLDATADYALKIPACNGTLAVCGFVGAEDGPLRTRKKIKN